MRTVTRCTRRYGRFEVSVPCPLLLIITQPQKNLKTMTTSVIRSASPQPTPTKQRNPMLQTVLQKASPCLPVRIYWPRNHVFETNQDERLAIQNQRTVGTTGNTVRQDNEDPRSPENWHICYQDLRMLLLHLQLVGTIRRRSRYPAG